MRAIRQRVLVAVTPRVLSDALAQMVEHAVPIEVIRAIPGEAPAGRYDLALVDAGTSVEAGVVVELLESGGCVVLHGDGPDRTIELRDAVTLVALLVKHLQLPAVTGPVRDGEHHPGASALHRVDGDTAAH